MVHCRRRFYELHQSTGSPLAEEALRRIGELYRIEAEVRGRPAEERRTAGRNVASRSWKPARLAHGPAGTGLGPLHPGRGDPLRPAPLAGLVLFLDDGRLELDTNTIERAIRPIAWGARILMTASQDAGRASVFTARRRPNRT
jgi:hypothetical protein